MTIPSSQLTAAVDSLDISNLAIEDDAPVDNLFSEKQQRLLTEPLYSSWSPGRPFLVAANVGLFSALRQPPVGPDVFLSLDVQAKDLSQKQNRSYFFWEFGKPPEVVIETVSNKVGNELGSKLLDYARMRISYYVVFDPLYQLGEERLRIYELHGRNYTEQTETWLDQVGLGLTLWEGIFEGQADVWLRWCDQQGGPILTGSEGLQQAKSQVQQAESLLDQERQRAQQLAERLRSLGVDPD